MLDATTVLLAVNVDWSEQDWIAYVVLGLIGFFYVLMPLIILGQQKFEARPRMIRFDRDDYQWPPEIEQLFSEAVEDLSGLGFEVVDSLFLPSVVQNVKTALVLLVHNTEQDGAMVTAMYAQPVTATSLKTLYVEYSTRFDDGFEFNTNNSVQMNSFPTPDETETNQFVTIKDAERLYRVHQAIMLHDGRNRTQKVLRLDRDFDGDAIQYLQNGIQEEFASAADNGYLRLSSSGEEYKLTPRGAFLMVWKELWPWKMVRKLNRNQQAKVLLNDLAREGVDVHG